MKRLFAFIMVIVLCVQFLPMCYGLEEDEAIFEVTDGYIYVQNDAKASEHDYSNATEIYFENCVIDDGDFLKNSKVEKIIFSNCEFNVDNFSFPITLNEVDYSHTSLQPLRFLKGIYLDVLQISYIEADDLSFLNGVFTNKLILDTLTLGSLNGVEKVNGITSLEIKTTLIESIEPVSSLTKLKTLVLDTIAIESIDPIKNLSLTELNVNNCVFIEDFDIITQMPTLSCVCLENSELIVNQRIIDFVKNLEYGEDYSQMLETQKKVKSIAWEHIVKGNTDDEKIKLVTKYILSHLKYDERVDEDGQLTLEYNRNGLHYALQGTGICSNYAEFTAALLNCVGIKTYIIDNHNHSFNMVLKNGEYYFLDTTWMIGIENSEEYELNENYMVPYTDSYFVETHEVFSLPSSLYNKIHNITVQETTEKTQLVTDDALDSTDENTYIYVMVLIIGVVVITIVSVCIYAKKRK